MQQWMVTLRFDGVPDPDHGPVSPIANKLVTFVSGMTCGDSYMEVAYAVNGYEDRADAILAVLEEAKRYAAEVGLPGNPEVHAKLVGPAAAVAH